MTHTPRGQSATVHANGLRHHLLRYPGSGPELLLLGGITTPALASDFLAVELNERYGYQVIVPDARGRGGTDRAEPGAYRLADYAADVHGIVTALGLDAPLLLGHSLGARIAAAAAPGLAHPGPIVLVDPPMSGPARPYPMSAAAFAEQLDEARRGTTPEQVARWFAGWPRRELEIRAQELATCDATAVAETHRGFETEDFTEYWRVLPPPLALIRGADSPVLTAADAELLGTLNPHARCYAVPGAGHMIPWENLPGFLDAFDRAVDQFPTQ